MECIFRVYYKDEETLVLLMYSPKGDLLEVVDSCNYQDFRKWSQWVDDFGIEIMADTYNF